MAMTISFEGELFVVAQRQTNWKTAIAGKAFSSNSQRIIRRRKDSVYTRILLKAATFIDPQFWFSVRLGTTDLEDHHPSLSHQSRTSLRDKTSNDHSIEFSELYN